MLRYFAVECLIAMGAGITTLAVGAGIAYIAWLWPAPTIVALLAFLVAVIIYEVRAAR